MAEALAIVVGLAVWGWARAFMLGRRLRRAEAALKVEQDCNQVMDDWITELQQRNSGVQQRVFRPEPLRLELLEQPVAEPPPLPRAPTLVNSSHVLMNRRTGYFTFRYKLPGEEER